MRTIGRYEILEEIARGGMGAVYKALDPAVGRVLALKLLHGGGNEIARKRFQREAKALARLNHRNVVRVFDFGFTPEGEPFMAMDFVKGESLQRRVDRDGPMDPTRAVPLLETLCAAVQACHDAGVLHRDLKPDNVLIGDDGRLRLTDFGMVRDTDPSATYTALTTPGAFLGSPSFWSPEQANGQVELIDARTDVYGLGATLYTLLTGCPPHEGNTLGEILAAIESEKRAPSALNPSVPACLDEVVHEPWPWTQPSGSPTLRNSATRWRTWELELRPPCLSR